MKKIHFFLTSFLVIFFLGLNFFLDNHNDCALAGCVDIYSPVFVLGHHEPNLNYDNTDENDTGCMTQVFEEKSAEFAGRKPENIAVVPIGWQARFTNKDHHLDQIAHYYDVDPQRFNTSGNNVNIPFYVSVCYDDRNNNDPYEWNSYYAVLGF